MSQPHPAPATTAPLIDWLEWAAHLPGDALNRMTRAAQRMRIEVRPGWPTTAEVVLELRRRGVPSLWAHLADCDDCELDAEGDPGRLCEVGLDLDDTERRGAAGAER